MKRIEKLVESYLADDGEIFATEKECLEYESRLTDTAIHRLNTLISKEPDIESIFTPSEINRVAEFIQKRFKDIQAIMPAPILSEGEWVPHVNWAFSYPPLKRTTRVEVMFESGCTEIRLAGQFSFQWNTTTRAVTNPHGRIVQYHIIKND